MYLLLLLSIVSNINQMNELNLDYISSKMFKYL